MNLNKTTGSLGKLLVSQSQADFMRAVEELLVTLDSVTLADGWCVLNQREWPKWELEVPLEHSQWAHRYLLNELTRAVPKKLRLKTWDRYCAKRRLKQMARDIFGTKSGVSERPQASHGRSTPRWTN